MIISKNDNLIIVKVFREHITDIDIYDVEMVCDFFKNLLIKIKKKYDIRGLCYIDVYTNNEFGMIIEIDNIYQYDDEVDIKISFHIDALFMKEVVDIDNIENEIYYYKDKYYACYDGISDSNIIYKNSLEIIDKGIRVK